MSRPDRYDVFLFFCSTLLFYVIFAALFQRWREAHTPPPKPLNEVIYSYKGDHCTLLYSAACGLALDCPVMGQVECATDVLKMRRKK